MASLNSNDTIFIERFLHSFKTIGGNELGFVDYREFKNHILKRTDSDAKGFLNLLTDEEHIQDGKLDFISLCFSILNVKTMFNFLSSENGKVPLISPRINTRTFTRNKMSTNEVKPQHKSSNSEASFKKSIKGQLFNINEDLLGYRYLLELLETSTVEIFAQGQCSQLPIEILVFQDSAKKTFITDSSIINDEGYCSVKFNLKKGKYIIIPILMKWDQHMNVLSEEDMGLLMQKDQDSNSTFTPSCETALKQVFKAIDLDGNGLLNKAEFDLFIQYTSGETATEEWTTVEDNFKMKNGQLTFEGFLELYRLVLQSDPPDILNMFQKMGMDNKFEFKNSQTFVLVVNTKTAKFNINPLPISSFKDVSEKVSTKMAIEQGVSSKIRNMNDLLLFKHCQPHRVTFVIQNQSHNKVNVQLDCCGSVNCDSHRKNLNYLAEVAPKTSMIGHHLFPVDIHADWKVECKASLK